MTIIRMTAAILFTASVCATAILADDPAELTRKGVELSDRKKYDEAARQFDRAIEIQDSASAKTHHNRGWVRELEGDFPGALKNYEEAIRRNPKQLPSYERAGYLYYKTGDFDRAVEAGEHVIKADPNNSEVIKWLPEAYRMRLLKQQEEMLAKQREEERRKKEEEERRLAEEKKEEKKPEEKEPARILYATWDFTLRGAYFFDGGNLKYVTTSGIPVSLPNMLYVSVMPTPSWEFDLLAGTPHLGALMPGVVAFTERFQALYHLEKWYLGVGVLGSHYKDDFNFGRSLSLHDLKVGGVLGFRDEKSTTKITAYPRFLPMDTSHSKGRTLDVGFFEFSYRYDVDKNLGYYSRISAADYYFFDHGNRVSNYYGVYELSLGLILGRYDEATKKRFLTLTVDLTERFYLRDFANDEPYRFANGQGCFGADSRTWFKGDAFPGYFTNGHVFSVRAEEKINGNFFVYQKLGFELTGGKGDRNEFFLLLGGGAVY